MKESHLKEIKPAEDSIAKEVAVEELFQRYVTEKKIHVEEVEGQTLFIVARSTADKNEAIAIVERLEMIGQFDRVKQLCFVNGMVDALQTYLGSIRKLAEPLKNEKAIQIGEQMLDYIRTQRHKI